MHCLRFLKRNNEVKTFAKKANRMKYNAVFRVIFFFFFFASCLTLLQSCRSALRWDGWEVQIQFNMVLRFRFVLWHVWRDLCSLVKYSSVDCEANPNIRVKCCLQCLLEILGEENIHSQIHFCVDFYTHKWVGIYGMIRQYLHVRGCNRTEQLCDKLVK